VQSGDPHRRVDRAESYVTYGPLGAAIKDKARRVVLIDEIDKAPRDFPNDLLHNIDRMEFSIPEAGLQLSSTIRPIVIITSNNERQLPAPFLRRCVFANIEFPGREKLAQIIEQRLGSALALDRALVGTAVARFVDVREKGRLNRVPGTSELLTWVHALQVGGWSAEAVQKAPLAALPLWQAFVKDRDDLEQLRRA